MTEPTWTPTPGKVLALRTCEIEPDGTLTGYGKFPWPSIPGAVVEAPDWDPRPCCGKGLHGLLWGMGDPTYLDRHDAVYMVVEVDPADVAWIEKDKVKFPRCTIALVTEDLAEAARLIAEHIPDDIQDLTSIRHLSAWPHRTFAKDVNSPREACPAGCSEYDCEHVAPRGCVEVPPSPVANLISSQIEPGWLATLDKEMAAYGAWTDGGCVGQRPAVPALDVVDWAPLPPDTGEPLHTIVLDLDIPASLIESSTTGHSHLYIDAPMPWSKYLRLLEVLADCGVIESGYYEAAKARGMTSVRLPWVRKPGDDGSTVPAKAGA